MLDFPGGAKRRRQKNRNVEAARSAAGEKSKNDEAARSAAGEKNHKKCKIRSTFAGKPIIRLEQIIILFHLFVCSTFEILAIIIVLEQINVPHCTLVIRSYFGDFGPVSMSRDTSTHTIHMSMITNRGQWFPRYCTTEASS